MSVQSCGTGETVGTAPSRGQRAVQPVGVRRLASPAPANDAPSRHDAVLIGIVFALYTHATALILLSFWMLGEELPRPLRLLVMPTPQEPPEFTTPLWLEAIRAELPTSQAAEFRALSPALDPVNQPDLAACRQHLFELLAQQVPEWSAGETSASPTAESAALPAGWLSQLIQPATPPPAEPTDAAPTKIQPAAVEGERGTGGVGHGGDFAEYFGVTAEARRIVYVIDASQSMFGMPFERARRELLYSVAKLTPPQSFGVVFFAGEETPVYPDGDALLPASEENLGELKEWVRRVRPHGGTQAETALTRALEFHPDVIFFLTDGAIPQRALEVAYQRPLQATVIHTIGFLSRSGETTLRQMADATHGVYRFVQPALEATRPGAEND